MMNELQIFNNAEFGQVRVVMIEDEPWFVGKDVAEALGYSAPRNAIASHVDKEDKKDAPIQCPLGGTQTMTIINESGVFSLILSSKLPTAKKFKRWVTGEVLPSIRKNGGYSIQQESTDSFEALLKQNELINKQNKVINGAIKAVIQIHQQTKEQNLRLEKVEKQVNTLRDANIFETNDWDTTVNNLINEIVKVFPAEEGVNVYEAVKKESYIRLQKEGRCDLNSRLRHRKMNAEKNGATKTAIKRINKLQVIKADKRLSSYYVLVLKQMLMKYSN